MGPRTTSTNYVRPYRPLPLTIANGVGRALDRLGLRAALDAEHLMHAALKANRADDFGDRSFEGPLRVLLDSVEREARLNPLGRLITRTRMVNILGNRLRAERLLQAHPEIRAQRVPPVILITGLQRTGTTLLHRLLAADPSTRTVLSWETINPVPPVNGRSRGAKGRKRAAALSVGALRYMAPDYFAVHPVEAPAPEEDVILLDYSFLSTVPEFTLRVPTYSAWLEEQDHRPAYAYLRLLLQILLWERGGDRLILKSPHHLEYLETALATFPDTVVVHLHRDPSATFPSFCSMVAHMRGIFSDEIDPKEIGEHVLRKTVRMVTRGIESRKRLAHVKVVDVFYDDLVRDPLRQIERIYSAAGAALTDETRAAMRGARTANVQYRYGRHRYDLEHFGVTPERLHDAYAAYSASVGLTDIDRA